MSRSSAEQITRPAQASAGRDAVSFGAAIDNDNGHEAVKNISVASSIPGNQLQHENNEHGLGKEHTQTVSLRAPPPVDKAAQVYNSELVASIRGEPVFSAVRIRPSVAYCARSSIPNPSNDARRRWPVLTSFSPENTLEEQEARRLSEWEQKQLALRQYRYVVVGVIYKDNSTPSERLRRVTGAGGLFAQIRRAEKELRSPLRRWLSLKRVAGFGIYECHPRYDYHSTPAISDETCRCLTELFATYRSEKYDYDDRWMTWIHENFNSASTDPGQGRYALRLQLQWSPVKLIVWSITPVLLSLAIGIWYMLAPHEGADHVAVVQTAWTIASYIVTTTALVLAIVASITQIGDI